MNAKLRILFVSSSRAPWYAKGMSAAAHFAAAPYSIDAIGYNLEQMGWTVAWLGWRDTANPFRLAKEIDAFRPDIVYTYGSTAAVWPIFLKRVLCRHRAFVVVHGWDDPYERIWDELFGWPGKLLMLAVQKFLVTRSDAVVTLSYALQKRGRAWGVACAYIPNGADPVDPAAAMGTIRLEGRFKLVYTGDKAKWKRTIDICRAMRQLPRDIKLYLTGRDVDYLKPYLSDNCISLGWLSKEEQRAVMSQADAFVCTSNQDCNAKLQEYLRWQKPILALHGEPDNFFKDGENALLAWDGDYAPLVRRLADDPALCRRLAANAAREIPVYSWAEIAAQFDAYLRGKLADCGRVGDLVSYSHADKTENNPHDQRNYRGGLHPFASARGQVLSDLGGIRMLAAEVSAERMRVVQHGEGASVREVSTALVSAAKKFGLFVPYSVRAKFGDLKRRRSGESEVYVGTDYGVLVKFKDPEAKQPLKGTRPSDWLFEHVIHNVLFPEARYEFLGLTEAVGGIRLVLRQENVESMTRPPDARIAADMANLGLVREGRYSFGNEVLSVTDVSSTSDNVLQGRDGKTYYIDPLIRLKRPAWETLEWLVGDLPR